MGSGFVKATRNRSIHLRLDLKPPPR